MKYLIQMNKFVRISTIAMILCVAMLGGSLVFKHGTAHACGNSIVSASTTTVMLPSGGKFVTVIFSLWYDSCNEQNFTSANITGGSLSNLGVFVHRNAGPDGGATGIGNLNNCPSTGICNSAGLYSPDNTSYAGILTNDAYTISSSSF